MAILNVQSKFITYKMVIPILHDLRVHYRQVFDRHSEFKTRGDKEFWARGYYAGTIGSIDEATVKTYIEKSDGEIRTVIKK